MPRSKSEPVVYSEMEIINKIHLIRNQKVMLDRDLAEMYGVPTSRLNEAVKRNRSRFPEDFMFQLTNQEFRNLISQIAISSWGGRRRMPFAFTEQGVAMLSSVLNSEIAIQVNIRIIRVYTKLKQAVLDNQELRQKIEQIERAQLKTKEQVENVFKMLKDLLIQESKPRAVIGFEIPKPK